MLRDWSVAELIAALTAFAKTDDRQGLYEALKRIPGFTLLEPEQINEVVPKKGIGLREVKTVAAHLALATEEPPLPERVQARLVARAPGAERAALAKELGSPKGFANRRKGESHAAAVKRIAQAFRQSLRRVAASKRT
jgi:hypothetical protein